ncbi:ABC transporter substrate-binding protein [Pseudomonas sp. NCCP-436]|uniref:substrate-binding periplasmic protein n=1 Tax=Pseudomonas sp. NCCP-436 TaxID=2842481 RepID=UPI001C816047|nr:ABC transporter substrate-binding protein [Pseudomonas sp. NCCP-436]GIZ11150.1 amino acid ABC transporter substrate-binding protein [Pseudomonas sp. NCCP-436]
MKTATLLLLFSWIFPGSVLALQLYTEEYPPISFSHEGQPRGMAVEVVKELLHQLDQSATLQIVPWARAYHIAQTTPGTAIFPTMRNPQREPLFKWVGPIILAHDNFYALRGSGISISRHQELTAIRAIAVPRDWFSYQELRAAGMNNLLGVNEPEQMFQLLRSGRVPLILADNLSFYARGEAAAQVAHLRPDEVEAVFPYRHAYGYIAFSLDTDDALIQRWQAALDAMKHDGRFSRIHQRWLPGAEEPGLRESQWPAEPGL